MKVTLRKTVESDLELFFQNQADEEANQMAAFTSENPNDKEAYITKWTRLLSADSVHSQTILLEEIAVGCVIKFVMGGDADITYALDKQFWGKGITSDAVKQFLKIETTRPIFGRTAFDNIGSQRILKKTGFVKIETTRGFANARGKEIKEFIYRID